MEPSHPTDLDPGIPPGNIIIMSTEWGHPDTVGRGGIPRTKTPDNKYGYVVESCDSAQLTVGQASYEDKKWEKQGA